MKYYKDGYVFIAPAKNKLKKYDMYKDDKYIISFGAIHQDGTPYDQYEDKIGHYSKYDHHDKNRKYLYYKRHPHDYPKDTADWASKKFLW